MTIEKKLNRIDKLHYISQSPENGTQLEAINRVLQSGGKWIQLRVKDQSEEAVLELAMRANALCKAYDARLIVNDYPRVALKSGADGVHLGLEDMPVTEARQIAGNKMIIGGTANTFEHILQRVAEGADYIGLGPYRLTTTKKNLSPVIGLEGYAVLMEKVDKEGLDIPIIAIGGIDLDDIPLLLSAGLYGVAVSGALTHEPQVAEKLKAMHQKIESWASKQEHGTLKL